MFIEIVKLSALVQSPVLPAWVKAQSSVSKSCRRELVGRHQSDRHLRKNADAFKFPAAEQHLCEAHVVARSRKQVPPPDSRQNLVQPCSGLPDATVGSHLTKAWSRVHASKSRFFIAPAMERVLLHGRS